MGNRLQAARSIVATVPQLLGVQVETADAGTADAVAEAIERIAEGLLRWHDRLALGADLAEAGLIDESTPSPRRDGDDVAPRAPAALRAGIRRGRLPGRPVTLHLAAAELRAVVRRVGDATRELTDVAGTGDQPDAGARLVVDQCLCLATELDSLADLLQTEGDRLTNAESVEQRDQVLARVVRGEHRLTRAAMVTLTP
ncbi:hypothetical protein [Allobranchiibius huperziae]|uniref:Uncharacterized protein n=1 Tax=Allobranchiibius huperziae TaxID=1874116 RepID=A0A853DGZ1_9MICO|nr:hypothetical protein [Allobranchiibius huperziae]NYJ74000.1 hypothetical protein [Allobranchiibius huperziae]